MEGLRFVARHPSCGADLACSAKSQLLQPDGLRPAPCFLQATDTGLVAGLDRLWPSESEATSGPIGAVPGTRALPTAGHRPDDGLRCRGHIHRLRTDAGFRLGPRLVNLVLFAATEFVGGLGVMLFDITSNSLHTRPDPR